jgi:cytochrome c-type biogenesis protein CcmH/NrfF
MRLALLVSTAIAIAVAATNLLGASTATAAEEFSADGFGYQLAHDMMSPFCPGRTLAQCPSGKAEELRIWILTQEAAGSTKEEVEAGLVVRYGEEIWPSPPATGLSGVGAYGIPLAMLIAGGPAAFFVLRRLTRSSDAEPATAVAAPAAAAPIDAALAAEIDRELGERGA